ncbi:hypothetical protein ACLMYS_003815 [Salmonella enterica]
MNHAPDHEISENEKLRMEMNKVLAETRKINTETRKLAKEALLYPILIATGLVSAVAAVTTAIVTLIIKL